jgi:hypothetical protein
VRCTSVKSVPMERGSHVAVAHSCGRSVQERYPCSACTLHTTTAHREWHYISVSVAMHEPSPILHCHHVLAQGDNDSVVPLRPQHLLHTPCCLLLLGLNSTPSCHHATCAPYASCEPPPASQPASFTSTVVHYQAAPYLSRRYHSGLLS